MPVPIIIDAPWTRLESLYYRFAADYGQGCYVYRPEPGAVLIETYYRPMDPSDVAKHGFPHARAFFEPREYVDVFRVGDVFFLRSGWLEDGYMQVGSFGKAVREALQAWRGESQQ